MKILVVNGGSSSFKFSLFNVIGSLNFIAKPIWKKTVEFKNTSDDRKAAIKEALLEVPQDINLIGHRIVHGGNFFQKPTLITHDVKTAIQKLSRLAPLHNPINLEGIDIAETLFPQVQQVGISIQLFMQQCQKWPGPIRILGNGEMREFADMAFMESAINIVRRKYKIC